MVIQRYMYRNYKYFSFSKMNRIAIQLITLKRKRKQNLRYFRHTASQE